ncbi:MAG: IS1182 family transposase [Verrucomicrobiia bacterium]|jgi:transposase
MNHRAGFDRHQTLLLPESLDDYVVPEHPVRFLDAFVASLNLAALGFRHATVKDTGRPPYDPADLLRLYLYGYLHRVRSSRLLERECLRNVEVIWLLRKLAPDHKTIADFRKDNARPLRAVGGQFRQLCQKLDLFGAELVGIDGSTLAAVNSRERNFSAAKLAERIKRAEAHLAEYLKALDDADATEAGATAPTPRLTREQLQHKIAQLKERKHGQEQLLQQLAASGEKQISLTDADARRAAPPHGPVVGYNVQTAVDSKHKLIVAEEVTRDVTDINQLATMAVQAQHNLGVARLEVVADTGYCNNDEVRRCVEAGITPYVPKTDTSANTRAGLFGKTRFRYDASKDQYACPAGAVLSYRFSTTEADRQLRYYRARDCRQCAIRAQCTRNQANRTITREAHEHLMEAMAERVRAHPQKMKQRKALCEHPFGTLKRGWGYGHFLLKGLAKVRGEWSLMTLAYNLRRVLNLVSFERLMAAASAAG